MTTSDERLEILKRNNPFTSSSVGDPWESKYPDVPSINEPAFKGLCQLIDQKSKNPALNCGGLILGEVGSGKTHLLGKVLNYSKEAKPPCSFAYIQPIEDPDQTFRYLLREIIVNLCHPMDVSPQATQLDRILAGVFIDAVLEEFQCLKNKKNYRVLTELRKVKDPVYIWRAIIITPAKFEEIQNKADYLIRAAYPEISKNFLKVLFQYRLPEKRPATVDWLKGSMIDQEDASLLQVPERLQNDPAALEQESRDILTYFDALLVRYHQLLVICFDRLENLNTDGQIHSLGKILEFLVDKAKAMLPIVCARGAAWEEKFREKFNQHVTTRLETNKFELRGCTAEQALALIRTRLVSVLGENPADEFFPFNKVELLKIFKTGFHAPRTVITRANQRLRQILDQGPLPQISPFQKLQEEFNSQYETILRDLDHHPPDRGRLRRALELYINHRPSEEGFQIESLNRGGDKEKYIDFIGTIRLSGSSSIPTIFIIDTEQNHSAVGASLTRGVDFLKFNPSGKAFYIRDARCPFPPPPKWRATNEKLQAFKKLGGHVIFLDSEQAARWYALALLSYAIKEGDVTIVSADNQIKPVSFGEFITFIQESIHGKKYSAFQDFDNALTTPPGKKREDLQPPSNSTPYTQSMEERAVEILRRVPMMMLPSQKLARSLIQSGIPVDLNTMLRTLSKFQDRFATISSKDDVLILLKKSWMYAQN